MIRHRVADNMSIHSLRALDTIMDFDFDDMHVKLQNEYEYLVIKLKRARLMQKKMVFLRVVKK